MALQQKNSCHRTLLNSSAVVAFLVNTNNSSYKIRRVCSLIIVLFLFACKKESNDIQIERTSLKGNLTDTYLSNNIQFINDSVLMGKFKLDIAKYEIENSTKQCRPITIKKADFREYHDEGMVNVGDLDGDKKDEFVFVLTPLNSCEEGDSYYFTNNNIPRIKTDSGCCHPRNILNIGDIDEDGKMEIAEYYSSCASRYKAITIYSFKKSKWKEIKSFSFVLNDQFSIEKDFKKLFRKISKNNLEYYEISDVNGKNELVASWKQIRI